ncbi:nuclear transport factor 2 family protein [Methanosphaerula palustris]|uniref:SnoaL-like domain-containing protein n=1 Tax=Methanosphaerula palustris (strain ATCC BAA-1556 / DSM 19958 / E1-9c) TaxID=521011 RepID=B8GIJ3_METPE|nr:nuclear transport factor 2 family protein [Methanosphaerula palustris]ACL16806.1 conserved hypothetical protein [Methanosphaerula palustris E1-9c]
MQKKLAQPIETYFYASNIPDNELIVNCFTEDAIVLDEGHTYRGHAAIRKWRDDVTEQWTITTEITGVAEKGGETVVTATVSGNFDGSPVPLDFHFTVENEKITALRIVLAGTE